jgi:hypothetical protein
VVISRLCRLDAVASDLAVIAPLADSGAGIAAARSDSLLATLADRSTEHFASDLLDLVRLLSCLIDLGSGL